MKSKTIITGVLVSVIMATGCARRVVVERPAPRVEVIPVAPSPRHVWVKGHYIRQRRNYVWVPGYYTLNGRRI